MKKMIKDTIDLCELNGATLNTWMNTLFNLQDITGTSAIISAYYDDDIGCIFEITYERLENNQEESERFVDEDLKFENFKNFAADNGVTITKG